MISWRPIILSLAFLVMAPPTFAQSAIERHTLQDRGLFEPFSRTAMAIPGANLLWGNTDFAEPGSTMRMTFEAEPSIDLVSVGASQKEWSLSGGKQTAEVFWVVADPCAARGQKLNGGFWDFANTGQ